LSCSGDKYLRLFAAALPTIPVVYRINDNVSFLGLFWLRELPTDP